MQIKIKNLSHTFNRKQYNEFEAVKDVSLEINQGEFITIIGPTGSGKTTLIEHFNALLLPSLGEIHYSNELKFKRARRHKKWDLTDKKKINVGDVVKQSYVIDSKKRKNRFTKDLRQAIGVVFQFAEYQLFEETIEKDIIFGPVSMGAKKEDAKKKAKDYLEMVGLGPEFLKTSPFSLSGGQKRRVAIAGILALEPSVLIFDEPTAGLDPDGEKEMYKIFNKLNEQGKTIIIVTHNLDHALEHSERTIMLDEGKLIFDGKTIDIMYDQKTLRDYGMQLPKLSSLVYDLNKKGKKIGKVRTIDELVKHIKKK